MFIILEICEIIVKFILAGTAKVVFIINFLYYTTLC